MKYTPQKATNKRDRIPKGQSRETGNKGYTRRRQTKQKHKTKTNKAKTQHNTTARKQTQITYIRHDPLQITVT